MSKYLLYCKTMENSYPAGKPTVCYLCAGEDFEPSFEELSNDILDVCGGCAILFRDRRDSITAQRYPAIDYLSEERLRDALKNVQAFFVHVTRRLFDVANRDVLNEISLAIANNIPIFPAATECGFDDLYDNSILSRRQYRLKNNPDKSAVPYKEKLKLFLDRAVAGEKLAERIRSEFRAKIFLSYRTSDRAAAQKLMRLIHAHDICRDTSIWYDQYLDEGKDFEKSILEILDDSDLMALAVTKNLLEEDNYVLRIEYPEAVKKQIEVFPVQMGELSEQDYAQLAAKYEGISDPVFAGDGEAILRFMSDFLNGKPSRGDTPAHSCLIGLAYLNGVGVEVDRDYAYLLLRDASERGMYLASATLASMYAEGNGVEQNNDKAYEYQKKAVGQLEDGMSDPADDESRPADRYITRYDAYSALAEFAENYGKPADIVIRAKSEAAQSADDAVEALQIQRKTAREADPALSRQISELRQKAIRARSHAAFALMQKTHYEEAEDLFRKQVKRLQTEYKTALTEDEDEAKLIKLRLLSAKLDFAELFLHTGCCSQTYRLTRECMEELFDMEEDYPTLMLRVRCRRLRVGMYRLLGDANQAINEALEGENDFRRIDPRYVLVKELTAGVDLLTNLYWSYGLSGIQEQNPGLYSDILALMERYPEKRRAVRDLQRLKLLTADMDMRFSEFRGIFYRPDRSDADRLRDYADGSAFKEAQEIANRFLDADVIPSADVLVACLQALNKTGRICRLIGEYRKSTELYGRVIDVLRRFYTMSQAPDILSEIVTAYCGIGLCCFGRGETDEAQNAFSEALRLASDPVRRYHRSVFALGSRRYAYACCALLYENSDADRFAQYMLLAETDLRAAEKEWSFLPDYERNFRLPEPDGWRNIEKKLKKADNNSNKENKLTQWRKRVSIRLRRAKYAADFQAFYDDWNGGDREQYLLDYMLLLRDTSFDSRVFIEVMAKDTAICRILYRRFPEKADKLEDFDDSYRDYLGVMNKKDNGISAEDAVALYEKYVARYTR